MTGTALLYLGMAAVFAGIFIAIASVVWSSAERAGRRPGRWPRSRPSRAAPEPMRRDLDLPFGERVIGPALPRAASSRAAG